jgi:cellulose synthase/poly-beta-1,6-N-acetylglucosamine synthase-like glycosyltransferase
MIPSNPVPLHLRASVIVPAYNAAQALPRCLESLEHQTIPSDHYEVIVVDDGSEDGTAEVAKARGARVLRKEHEGPAAARNAGAALARSDIIVFTDADCEPAPDFLERLLAPFDIPQVSGARGVYRTRQRSLVARFVQLEYEERYQRMARLDAAHGGIDAIDTAYAAYRLRVFQDAGGFDTRFRDAAGEDHELSFRLAQAGHVLRFVPDAVVFHRHPERVRDYARRKFRIGYWRAFLTRRHPQRVLSDAHTTPGLKLQIALAALMPIALVAAPFWPPAWGVLLALMALFLLSALPLFKLILRRDRPVLLIALPMLFVRAYALGLGFLAGLTFGPAGLAQQTPALRAGRH